MNKVICNVCGTSYPENSSQCPICGFARSSETNTDFGNEQSSYTYVKGGRFSKANVRKRNQANQKRHEDEPAPRAKTSKKKEEKSNTGLVVIIIILLLAIIAVVGYIAVRFFLPDNTIGGLLNGIGLPSNSQSADPTDENLDENVDDSPEVIPCQSISLSKYIIELEPNATHQISVTLTPSDTSDPVQFTSSDGAVAAVDASGMVTAYTEGTAVITVSCGSVTTDCTVVCAEPTTEPETTEPVTEATEQASIVLNRKEITFDIEGQTWVIYDGPVALSDIIWSSDDNSVATVQDGKVTAVGNGDTTIYATYNGNTVSCLIHCKLDEDSSSDSNISEAGGESKRTYRLYNPTGYSDDVTIKVGEKFTLKLVDENKKEVTGATWNVENPKYCSYEDNTVKGLASGTTKITATYEGVTYTCLVRVI